MRVNTDSVGLAWKSPVGVRELGNGPLWHSAGVIIMTPRSGDGQRACPLCLQLRKVETEGLWVSLPLTPRLPGRLVNTEGSVSPMAWLLESFRSPWQLFSWASISLGHLPHLRYLAEMASKLGSKQG